MLTYACTSHNMTSLQFVERSAEILNLRHLYLASKT
jgi:hypothetical protein